MSGTQKITNPIAPELVEKTWSARESWRVFGIMAEFVESTERLAHIRPAVSFFGSARMNEQKQLKSASNQRTKTKR